MITEVKKRQPRSIQLQPEVYDRLTGLMGPKETYSQVVERILVLFDKMGDLRDILSGAIAFRKGQQERLEKRNQGDVIGTDLQGNDLIKRRSEP